jgi:hypothetical protein
MLHKSPYSALVQWGLNNPTVQIKKLGWQLKYLVWGHTTWQQQSQNSNSVHLPPKASVTECYKPSLQLQRPPQHVSVMCLHQGHRKKMSDICSNCIMLQKRKQVVGDGGNVYPQSPMDRAGARTHVLSNALCKPLFHLLTYCNSGCICVSHVCTCQHTCVDTCMCLHVPRQSYP